MYNDTFFSILNSCQTLLVLKHLTYSLWNFNVFKTKFSTNTNHGYEIDKAD